MTGPTPERPRRRVLLVSPHFPPVNAPDMQRARIALPYFRELGWEPVVLAIEPRLVEGAVVEPLLEDTYPADIRVIRVGGLPPAATRWAGIGSLWLRCGAQVRREGDRLLREEKFDLVFFTTTQFHAFALGPRWKRKFGVPYVLDYQDPWVNDYYERTGTKPPGGRLKFALSQWSARRLEPAALRGAGGVVAVSAAYGETLARQYAWFDRTRFKVLPFGAAAQDVVTARRHTPAVSLIDFDDGCFHHVYTGRCGPDMSTSLSILFRAFKVFLGARPEEARRVRFHFIGTDYAPRPFGREWAMPVARVEGVEDFVTEECYRVPYFDALYYLIHAQAIIGVGSNDPTYSASKIYPYVLAARPMLLVFNRHSAVLAIARELDAGARFAFGSPADIDGIAAQVARDWFLGGGMLRNPPADMSAFGPYTAAGMTRELAGSFEQAAGRPPP